MPDWTKKQCDQMKNFKAAWRKDSDTLVWPFLNFCVENWSRIGILRFGWMKGIDYPEYPSIDFLMGFKKHFVIAFADEKFHERQISATERGREFAKLKKMGYTDEQAEKEIEFKQKNRGSLQKEINRANQAEARAAIVGRENQNLQRKLRQSLADKDKIITEAEAGGKKEMNRGSEKPKKKVKRDKDGYAIFEG